MDSIRFVLVETSHPGNIGAAARAMKTMGFGELVLVSPVHFPHPDAVARATGADDVVAAACVCETLDEALAGCELVLGASARQRSIAWPAHTPRGAAALVAGEFRDRRVAVVFGRERTGLDNSELERCHALVTIPANPDFSSLNIAAAVQVIAYELRVALLEQAPDAADAPEPDARLATADELAHLYAHFERVMIDTGFLDPERPRHLMRRLRRLFNRAHLDENELNILRGFLSSVEEPTGPKHRG